MTRKQPEAPPTEEFLAAMDQHYHRGKTSMMLTLVKKRRQRINNRTTWEVFEGLKVLVPREAVALEDALARLDDVPDQLSLVDTAPSNGHREPRNDEERLIVRLVEEQPDGVREGTLVNYLCDEWKWDRTKDAVRKKAYAKAMSCVDLGLIRRGSHGWFFPVA